MASPDQNKANVKAFYDLAFNQRQPEEAVKQSVGSSYRQHNPMAGDGTEPFIGFVKWITGENLALRVEFKRFIAESDHVAVHSHMIPAKGSRKAISESTTIRSSTRPRMCSACSQSVRVPGRRCPGGTIPASSPAQSRVSMMRSR
jgi:predicted SnoaL-like aldol condensation-catalyzing enzyme